MNEHHATSWQLHLSGCALSKATTTTVCQRNSDKHTTGPKQKYANVAAKSSVQECAAVVVLVVFVDESLMYKKYVFCKICDVVMKINASIKMMMLLKIFAQKKGEGKC